MKTVLIAGILALAPTLTHAQEAHSGMNHDAMMQSGEHSTEGGMQTGMATGMDTGLMPATEAGQSAFAAIEEIVLALSNDPDTDWSKVDIDGLREHLVDMELVFTDADVTTKPVDFGLEFTITGTGKTTGAIQRMTVAHSGVMEDSGPWSFNAVKTDTGAVLTVTTPVDDLARMKAIGFFGIISLGMHHQEHHWMMATGSNPHQ
jgi:hypothetical protein